MQLFKYILTTFFPQKLLTQQFNPISMMLSVLSPKQFFDYVSRRITDNYKLNLSDISLDSYVRSISPFAAHHGLAAKDIELYYGYHAAGHLNGHTSRLPDTVASTITLALVRYAYPSLPKEHQQDDLSLAGLTLTVYFLIYLFMTHIKVFGYTADPDPASRKKETYNWFVTLFSSFYEYVGEIQDADEPLRSFDASFFHSDFFGMLYDVCYHAQFYLSSDRGNQKELFSRLCNDSRTQGVGKNVITEFVAHYPETCSRSDLSSIEKLILKTIFPNDILLKHLFQTPVPTHLLIKHFLGGLYPPHETKNAISAIKSGEITLLQRVDTLLKPQRYTGDYIDIVKELAHASFATLDDPDESWHEIVEQIQAGDVDVSNIELPEKIKRESELFEHLINFYLTFMGRLFVGRGDNGYTRYAYRSFISQLLFSIPHQMQTHSLSYYGSLLRLYATNVMYYKSFYKKTKETTKSFDYLASSLQHLYANAFTIDMLHEHAIATTLSDLTPKHRRLVVPQAEIIESFKSSFGETIHEQISSDALLTTVYQPVLEPLTSAAQLRPLRTQLHEQTTPDSITALKNALYTPDFQIRHHAITQPRNQPHHHSNRSHLLMASTLRETLRGALILYDNIDNDHHRTQIASWYEYCVMHIAGTTYLADSSLLLPSLAHHYASLLTQRRQIDENASYTTLISTILSTQHDEDDTISTPTPKEHLRLLNITKHMTYYNKRYCIPSF